MPRKTAAPKEPASLPDVTIPPSEAPANQRSAYWLALIDDPAEFRRAVASEDFFPMLREFPEAFWGGRLSLYLYRLPDSEGMMVKNAEGEKKYIKVLRFPIDEEWVSQRYGGGKYMLYLKLDSKESLRQHTFPVDGPPKVQPGQTVEIEGKHVSVGSATQSAPAEDRTDIAKVIDASSKANESAMGILAHASETAIDMVKAQSVTASAPQKDPLDTALRLIEILRPANQADPTTLALTMMERFESIIAKRNPAPEPERPETPVNESLDLIEKLTGRSVSELMQKGSKVADPTPSWVPLALTAVERLFQVAPQLMREARETRDLEFQRAVWLRANPQPGAAVPPNLLPERTAPPNPTPGPTLAHNQAAPANGNNPLTGDPGQAIGVMVNMICDAFDKDPRSPSGFRTAAAIDFHFCDVIESMGIEAVFAVPEEIDKFVEGHPALAQRSKDARWAQFQTDFLDYTMDRWGDADDEEERGNETPINREKPPAA
jgi:hypothetical protein